MQLTLFAVLEHCFLPLVEGNFIHHILLFLQRERSKDQKILQHKIGNWHQGFNMVGLEVYSMDLWESTRNLLFCQQSTEYVFNLSACSMCYNSYILLGFEDRV